MRVILEHIKAQTVPHDMLEELFQSGVPFYDGKSSRTVCDDELNAELLKAALL